MFTNKNGFNGNTLKLLAIIAMTIDHVAWLFLPLESFSAQICHIIGRLTFPIMSFMIVEGYHHTRNVKKYLVRLAIGAFLAHFTYAFCFHHPILFDFSKNIVDTTSVLWGFTCGLSALIFYHNKRLNIWLKAILILLCITLSIPSDWSWVCVVFLLVIDLNYTNFKRQMFWMTVFGWSYAIVYCFVSSWWNAYQFAIVLAFPVLYLYNGERGLWKGMKWFFYLYYPFHFIILGIIKALFSYTI